MAENPLQYKRPTVEGYDVQIQAQKNAALISAEKKKQESETQKKLLELNGAKANETYYKNLKVDAEKQYAVANKAVNDAKIAAQLSSSDGGSTITPAEETYINTLIATKNSIVTKVNEYTKQYQDAYNKRITIEQSMTPPSVIAAAKTVKEAINSKNTKKDTSNKSSSTKGTNTNESTAPKVPNPLMYYYNAPMVSTAYLRSGTGNSLSPQQSTTSRSISGTQNYIQGLDAWKDTVAAKGVIQMDAKNAINFTNSSSNNLSSYDSNLYGFKFLYNPKEVAMTWGVAEGMNWEAIQAGLDPGTAPTAALKNSTISFSLLLNRIQDMNYLDANGLKAGFEDPYSDFATVNGKDTELRYIYAKGTMYDLEYLFRAVSGLNADFYSGINGWTADRGWLYGIAVELHLGNYLRYMVRLNNLEVNHVMFDERMVPILTHVNISCARFNYLSAE